MFALGHSLGAVQVENVVPHPGTAAYVNYDASMTWGILGPYTDNVIAELKRIQKGSWYVYHKNLDNDASKTDLHPSGDDSQILMFAGTKNSQFYTQAYTAFTLSDEVLAAERARISFELGYVGKADDSSISINISGSGWTVVEVTPGLRSAAASAYTPSASFSFGLINLATDEIYGANISGEENPYMFDFNTNDWFVFNTDENGTVTVSFELDSDQLKAVTDAGLGLFIRSNKTGDPEVYKFGNFATEIIPEPAAYALAFAVLALALAARRRR